MPQPSPIAVVGPDLPLSTPFTLHSAAVGAGNGFALALSADTNSATVLAVDIGAGGSIVPEVSVDDITWYPITGINIGTAAAATVITTSGAFVFDTSGWFLFRARVAAGPGPIRVLANDVTGAPAFALVVTAIFGVVTVAGTVTANQGTPNTLANGWPVTLTDGVSVLGTPANPLEIAAAALDVFLSTRASEATAAATLAGVVAIFGQLDVALSTRASETTVASILAQLDVALSTRASEATVVSILGQLDVALSTRASEATLLTRASEATVASILAQLDVALSTRASEVTVAAILGQLDVALSTRASEATLLTRASEATVFAILGQLDVALSTRASEATVFAILGQLDVALSTRASEATLLTRASEATVASILAQLDVALSTRASEATVASILAQLDVALSTRASEATLLTRASEATVAAILAQFDVALSTRASEATVAAILGQLDVALSTRASEATLLTRASEATVAAILAQLDVALSTRASEATVASILAQLDVALSTRASEATLLAILAQLDVALSTRASEATVASILGQLDVALSTRASEATLLTRASEATVAAILAQLDVALSTRASEATLLAILAALGTFTGPSKIDDSPFAIGVDRVAPMGALADEVAPDSVDEGDVGIPRMSLNRVLFQIIRDGLGNERAAAVNAANELSVTDAAAEATLVSILGQLDVALSTRASQATVAAILAQLDVALSTRASEATAAAILAALASKIDDSPFAIGVDRVAPMGALADEVAPDSVDEGDVGIPRMSLARILYTQIRDGLGNERGAAVNAANELSVTDAAAEATLVSILGQLDVALSTRASEATVASILAQLDVALSTRGSEATLLAILAALGAPTFTGPSKIDDSAFAIGVDRVAPMGALADEVAPDSVDEGDVGIPRMTLARILYVNTKTPLTASAPTFATVGAASVSVVAANVARKGLVLTNTSNQRMSFGIGVAAVFNSGITLEPDGVWEMGEYTFTTAEIFAISNAAAKNLAIQEFST